MHAREAAFTAVSADNLKKYKLPEGQFLHNFLPKVNAGGPGGGSRHVTNAMAVNEDDVVVTGGDNGLMCFWDWRSGNCF